MKVGLLTSSFPRHVGDTRGIFVLKLAESLERSGVSVEVIEPKGFGALKKGSGLVANLKGSVLAKLEFPAYCLCFLILAVWKGASCDLLHANWSLAGFFAVLAGKITNRRVLLTERSLMLIETNNRWLNGFTGWVMRRSGALVTISETARLRLKAKFPNLEFHVIPNGVDHELFSKARSERAKTDLELESGVTHFLTVGRLTPLKRLDVFLDALSDIVRKGLEFRAWVIGEGELRDEMTKAISARDELARRVTLLGRKRQEEVAMWMAAADVFVLCSEGEAGGNVVLEAMSAGLAVVATPVGWAADLIADGENGMLSPVGDTASLARKMQTLLTDPDRIATLGKNARKTIEEKNLTWKSCAERYRVLYEILLSRNR